MLRQPNEPWSAIMNYLDESVNEGVDRLQRLLLAMHNGDKVLPCEVAQFSGPREQLCRAVLEGLTRAGLMSHDQDDRFVLRPLNVMISRREPTAVRRQTITYRPQTGE